MPRTPLVLGALAALVGLFVAVVYFRAFGAPEVGSGLRTYDVRSDTSVQVSFEVRKDPAQTAVCTLRARSATGAEVGQALVRVGPADARSTVVSYDLATTGRATLAEVTGCVPEPQAPAGTG